MKELSEQIKELYLTQNLSSHKCQDILNISRKRWKRLVKKYNIKKPEKIIRKNRVEHTIENLQAKYGKNIVNVMQLKKTQEQRLKTIYTRNNGQHYASTESWRQKHSSTRRKNHTWNTSKFEEEAYQLLLRKFTEVIRQYKCEPYPWHCDFYIPEEELFIEIQGSAFHGSRPYDPKDEVCQDILNKLLKRDNSYSNQIIHNWMDKDVKKRNTAKANNLNFKEFFSMQEFRNWYDNI